MKITMFKTKKGNSCLCLTAFSENTGREEIITFDNKIIMKFATFSQLAELETQYKNTGHGSINL